MPLRRPSSRRRFLIHALAGVSLAGYWSQLVRGESKSANEKLNVGAIGYGGWASTSLAFLHQENVAAICDCDEAQLEKARARFPDAAQYVDFRKLLDHPSLDAIVISTPDHWHYHQALAAMQRGLHVYCEKPLAHSVWEARELARVAAERKLVTQMGVQHHPLSGYRKAVAYLKAGHLGEVREVHAWTDRPRWPQGIDRPRETPPAPKGLHWNLWLGPAPLRPYHPAYHPFAWRGWWDFGAGALGDIGPHALDLAFEALGLTYPESISTTSSAVNNETTPSWSRITFDFPAHEKRPAIKMFWYDGGQLPPASATGTDTPPPAGTLFVGTRGRLYAHDLGERVVVAPLKEGEERPRLEPVAEQPSHHAEWAAACKKGGPTSCNFTYSARLTETCLLGNIALRVGKPLQWNAEKTTFLDSPAATALVRTEYRDWAAVEDDKVKG